MDYIREKCLLVLTATALVWLWTPWTAGPVEGRDERVRQDIQLKGLREDPRLLLGAGSAEFPPPDVGDARRKAMSAAERKLIDAVVEAMLPKARALLRYEDADRTPAAEKALADLVRNFAGREVRRRRIIEFKDYPDSGVYTAALFLIKAAVERDLEAELGAKRDIVIADVNDAAIAGNARDWPLSVRSYVTARDNIRFFFDEIPMRAVVTGRPEEVVLARHVDARLRELVERIEIRPLRGEMLYGGDGRPREPVEVSVTFPFAEGPRPITDAALNVRVFKGHARVGGGRAMTDAWGKAVVSVEWADPAEPQVVLDVSLDTSTLPGIPEVTEPPRRLIPLWRSRAVAFSLLVRADTGRAEIPRLRENLRQLLQKSGFESIDVALDTHVLGEEQIEKVRRTKADFLLLIDFLAATQKEEAFNMYSSLARTRYSFYRLPDAVQTMDERGPEAHGRSSNRAKAVSYAVERIEPELLRQVKEKLDKLR